jgi:hypothetical protein
VTRGALLIALLGAALSAWLVPAQSPPPDPRSWVGERLQYDAKFGFLTIGGAELSVAGIDTVRGDSALHIRFVIQGHALLYSLHDEWDSWVGLSDFTSRRFIQNQEEGNRQYRNAYDIYPDSGYYRREGVDSLFPTSPQPLDDAAFFYFVRTVDLSPGRHEFDRYFKPDRNPVVLDVVGRDTIDVPAGRFDCIVVRPVIKGGGIFKEGAEGRLWISDDAYHRVVQIKSKFFFGSLTFRLTRIVTDSAADAVP